MFCSIAGSEYRIQEITIAHYSKKLHRTFYKARALGGGKNTAPMNEPFAHITFSAMVFRWRGPAPFFFAAIPDAYVGEVRHAALLASYGWGCVPIIATIGELSFTTSLFPKNDTYLVPLKIDVRRKTRLALADIVTITLEIHDRV